VLNFQLTFKFYVGQHFSDWLPNVCPKSRTIISLGLIKENLTHRRWRHKKACYNNNSINLKPIQNEAEKARADRPKTERRARKGGLRRKGGKGHTHKDQGPIIRYEVDANNAPMHTMDMMTMMKRTSDGVR